jgi:hypothetical protein
LMHLVEAPSWDLFVWTISKPRCDVCLLLLQLRLKLIDTMEQAK